MIAPKPAGEQVTRMTGLIWGPSGEGKTTLAATAPGRKLLCLFDPDGHASIAGRMDVDVLKYYEEDKYAVARNFPKSDSLSIEQYLKDDTYQSIIVDSVTNSADISLDAGVASPLVKGSAVERPAPGSYQIRNRYVLKLIKNTLALTGKYNKHVFFIGHEDSPETDNDGNILFTSILLGGDLPNSVPIDFSEVWRLWSNTKGKVISIRSSRGYKPMKTRMFKTDGEPEFPWRYNPDLPDDKNTGMTIKDWWSQWQDNGKRKLALPK